MPSSRANAGLSSGRFSTASARPLHLPHRAQCTQQWAGDQGFAARAVGSMEVYKSSSATARVGSLNSWQAKPAP